VIRAAFALLGLLAGGVAEARFAPLLDTPYRLVRVQEHHDARDGMRRFRSERWIVFARREDGYLVRMTLVGTQDTRADSDYAMLAAALNGGPIEVELDRAGRMLRVRDLDAIWARLRTAIGTAAMRDDLRLALWRVHDAATTGQRVQVVAGLLSTALGPDDAERRPGSRAVTLPSIGAVRSAATVRGTETVRVEGARVSMTITAAGGEGATGLRLERRRTVDRRSGLMTEQHDDQRVGSDGEAGVERNVTTISLSPAVS
jgi:hypothetical protein